MQKYGLLIIDDQDDLRKLVVNFIERSSKKFDYEIFEAPNGLVALDILQDKGEHIHLMTLDFAMPEMNGQEFLKVIINGHKHIVGIIGVTAHRHYEELLASTANEFIVPTGYLLKPFNPMEMLASLDRTLEQIIEKRKSQGGIQLRRVFTELEDISGATKIAEAKLNKITEKIDALEMRLKETAVKTDEVREGLREIHHRFPTFLEEMGKEIIKIVVIGLFILLLLHFSLDSFIAKVIRNLNK